MRNILMIISLCVSVQSFAQTPTPTAVPIPTPVKSLLDPCKMQTMSQDHADWKLKNCK